MEPGLKFRSVCDYCTKSKVKCSGTQPCDKCTKKGIECHFRPMKHRGNVPAKKKSSIVAFHKTLEEVADDVDDHDHSSGLEDYERRTWSVFFALYKNFKFGCASLWFRHQLVKMLKLLEDRSESQSARSALTRIKDWAEAIGIEVPAEREKDIRNAHVYRVASDKSTESSTIMFHRTVDDVLRHAKNRNLAVLRIDDVGAIEVNEQFSEIFAVTKEELEGILHESEGGFLPWGGDVVARIVSSEKDLSLYLQIVAINLDQIGNPTAFPTTRVIPSAHILSMIVKGSPQGKPCLMRALQVETVEYDDVRLWTTLVFEFESTNNQNLPVEVPSFEPIVKDVTSVDVFDDAKSGKKRGRFEVDDDTWLEGLLKWASSEDEDDISWPADELNLPGMK